MVRATAKKTVTGEEIAAAFQNVLNLMQQYSPDAVEETPAPRKTARKTATATSARKTAATPAKKTASRAAAKSTVEKGSLDQDEVEGMSVKDLRALAVEAGLREQKLKSGILTELEKKGFYAEAEEGDEEEEEGYTREGLAEETLVELKKIAKSEGHTAADYRGMDQESLIDLILGEEEDEEEEDEDEEDADEEEEAEEDEDEEDGEIVIDPEELKTMPIGELKELAKQINVKIPSTKAKSKSAIIKLILDSAESEEEEE